MIKAPSTVHGHESVKEGKSANQRKSELDRAKVLQIQSFNTYLNAYRQYTASGSGDRQRTSIPVLTWLIFQ